MRIWRMKILPKITRSSVQSCAWAFVLILFISAAHAQQVRATQPSFGGQLSIGPKAVPDEILVRFKPDTTKEQRTAVHGRIGATVITESTIVSGLTHLRLAPGMDVSQALRQYR